METQYGDRGSPLGDDARRKFLSSKDDDDLVVETESSDALSLTSAEDDLYRTRRPSNPHARVAGTAPMTREFG